MALKYPLVHIDDVAPEVMEAGDGWQISEFRLPITGACGASTTAFHSVFRPGSRHKKHLHSRCEKIAFALKGRGVVGIGNGRADVRGGHFHYIPKGVEHWCCNLSQTEAIGSYIGAGSVAETGYVYLGDVTERDLKTHTN